MRRVLVGHDAQGKSVVVSDAEHPALSIEGTGKLFRLWSADGPATYPDNGLDPEAPAIHPGVGGIRVTVAEFPPGQLVNSAAADKGQAIEWDDSEPGMHRTDTTDIDIVLSGEIILDLDDGVSVTLRKGDVVVLGGARHRWRNEGSETAVVAFFLTGSNKA